MAFNFVEEFTNTRKLKIERLIKLLPFETVKNEFALERKISYKKAASTLAAPNRYEELFPNFTRSFGLTHQHVHLYRINQPDLRSLPSPLYSERTEYFEEVKKTKTEVIEDYILPLEHFFKIFVGNTLTDKSLKYFWPIRIHIKGKVLQIHINPMKHSFPKKGDGLYYEKPSLDEKDIRLSILKNIKSSAPDRFIDFNKGIKFLLRGKSLDILSTKYRTTGKAQNTQMLADYVLSKYDPEQFAEVLANPIAKSKFLSYLKEDYPAMFSADPSNAFFSFPTHPNSSLAIQKLIDLVLEKN